jgi:hypothetical protein
MECTMPEKEAEPLYLSVPQAARVFAVSQWSIRDLISRGVIDAKRFGRRQLPVFNSLKRHFDALPDAARPQRAD